ncbi:hypothetical protein C923_04403 [Plasmodium falciparum UGT5.1]|uniref:Uncharacterized protein n=5 Tax=Plasmodium falciparum TaxID=5833 RepID=W7K2J0_PLAFO|nr:hypothetical protein PFFVO_03920 [Plasmodium falciparum Vietnam Oak-Knoll (FVO)]ETW35038.1 hypothetical protein PFTANZ_04291 [Plasmodium falciparum Tanzania (2000708)]EUR66770.1 hypothetical protein PFBG_04350 [Plasmodium falciparum 7G8]EWC74965.1 hypothetical protein C923_04403 [Plasmodium falciparum UGT5.1]EWC86975.1 hypothetical protein PFNF54_04155 [Plasmodium falciparum NF54]
MNKLINKYINKIIGTTILGRWFYYKKCKTILMCTHQNINNCIHINWKYINKFYISSNFINK